MKQLVGKANLYCHSLDVFNRVVPTVACEVRLLKEMELKLLHEVWRVDLEGMKVRLRRGDQCFVCFTDGRIAHYSWVQFSGMHEVQDVGQRFEIFPGHCWIYHCRTAVWAQGKQIYPFVLAQILDSCSSHGCQQGWIYTSPQNIASQNGIRKAGFSFYKQLISINLFNYHIPVFTL